MWQKGLTGYPFVDAGMRQLWQTGYLHNRVRMVVASFLVKNLNIPWQAGRDWFWDCLLDADLANNSASWQWVAGCGVDAAPYFRIFNPITQGEKFDSQGVYTKQFLPELQKMPAKYLFKPWLAPKSILQSAGVELGKTYPYPLVDLGSTRLAALERYGNL
jgi:deoxyribodipyrimidine photo-lyase